MHQCTILSPGLCTVNSTSEVFPLLLGTNGQAKDLAYIGPWNPEVDHVHVRHCDCVEWEFARVVDLWISSIRSLAGHPISCFWAESVGR